MVKVGKQVSFDLEDASKAARVIARMRKAGMETNWNAFIGDAMNEKVAQVTKEMDKKYGVGKPVVTDEDAKAVRK